MVVADAERETTRFPTPTSDARATHKLARKRYGQATAVKTAGEIPAKTIAAANSEDAFEVCCRAVATNADRDAASASDADAMSATMAAALACVVAVSSSTAAEAVVPKTCSADSRAFRFQVSTLAAIPDASQLAMPSLHAAFAALRGRGKIARLTTNVVVELADFNC